jgi:predicted dehydrogenase
MAKEIGVGLIGYGAIGRLHALCYQMLPLVYPDLPLRPRLAAVATAGAASAERARRELGDVVATTDAMELLRRDDIALIDCCAPTGDHAHLATATLESGKALFCEKPLTADAAASEQLATLAGERGLPGGVNYHFRFVPALLEARRMVEDGLLGDVTGFQLRYYRASNLRRDRPATWRFAGPGSGVLVDLGSHLIDLVLYLLGPISGVSARLRTVVAERPGAKGGLGQVASYDAAWLEVELAGGGRGSIAASKVVPGAGDDLRIEAYGTCGALLFDTLDPNNLVVAEGVGAPLGGRRIATASRTLPSAALPGPETPTGVIQWHLASLAAFLRALDTSPPIRTAGDPSYPTLAAGLAVDRVLAAAFESAALGGASVHVPFV